MSEYSMESCLVWRKTMDDQVNAYLDMGMDFSNLAEKTIKDLEKKNLEEEIWGHKAWF